MFGWFKTKTIQRENALALYKACVDQSRLPVFYEDLQVKDTLEGRFEMICLHGALIIEWLYHLKQDELAQRFFDVMFKDIDLNLREAGVGDLAVPKRMKKMMKALKGRAFAYREGILSGTLEDSIARNLATNDNNVIEVFSGYIVESYRHAKLSHLFPMLEHPHKLFLSEEYIMPWQEPWAIDGLDRERVKFTITPDKDKYESIVKFLDLASLQEFSCDLDIVRKGGQHIVHITGRIKATLEQVCVQSLEPVPTSIDEEFEAHFADREEAVPFSKAKKELFSKYGVDDMPILEEEEDPEPIKNGKIDLGVLAIQYLSLSLDPYPRREGLESQFGEPETIQIGEAGNPFAALKDWNKKE